MPSQVGVPARLPSSLDCGRQGLSPDRAESRRSPACRRPSWSLPAIFGGAPNPETWDWLSGPAQAAGAAQALGRMFGGGGAPVSPSATSAYRRHHLRRPCHRPPPPPASELAASGLIMTVTAGVISRTTLLLGSAMNTAPAELTATRKAARPARRQSRAVISAVSRTAVTGDGDDVAGRLDDFPNSVVADRRR